MEEFAEVPNNLDAWIETLFTCKPLKEGDIKSLCEQVHPSQLDIQFTTNVFYSYSIYSDL
jgi:hypothetical protein